MSMCYRNSAKYIIMEPGIIPRLINLICIKHEASDVPALECFIMTILITRTCFLVDRTSKGY